MSRFVPSFLCPSCAEGTSLKKENKKEEKENVKRKSKQKDLVRK